MGKRADRAGRNKSLLSPKLRAYMYGIFLALSPVGIYYGMVTAEEAGLWIAVASTVLAVSNGTALANVPGVSKDKGVEDAGQG